MPAEKADYEYERLGYERRLAAPDLDPETAADLKAQVKALNEVIKGLSGGRETAAREPGERAVQPKAEKRG